MTPEEIKAMQALADGFSAVLRVLAMPPPVVVPTWCECGHVVEAHPLSALNDRPCKAGPCACREFTYKA